FATTKSVVILLDGEPAAVQTHARPVAGALREAAVELDEADLVRPALESPIDTGAVIEIQRARDVLLEVDGILQIVRTTLRPPTDILAEAGWTLFPGDRLWVDGLLMGEDIKAPALPPTRWRLERA